MEKSHTDDDCGRMSRESRLRTLKKFNRSSISLSLITQCDRQFLSNFEIFKFLSMHFMGSSSHTKSYRFCSTEPSGLIATPNEVQINFNRTSDRSNKTRGMLSTDVFFWKKFVGNLIAKKVFLQSSTNYKRNDILNNKATSNNLSNRLAFEVEVKGDRSSWKRLKNNKVLALQMDYCKSSHYELCTLKFTEV